MIGTIVVGVDGGAEARDAIALASVLRGALGAELVLAHAYPYDLLPLGGTVVEVGVAEDLHDEALRFVAELRDELAPGAAIRVLPDTSPARALHEVCEDVDAGLLVMGSAARGAAGRSSAGETTRTALHHAPCPVLVAPREAPPRPPRTIGVGFDDSPQARHARELAERIATAVGARLELIEAERGRPAETLVERSAALDLLVLGSRGLGPVRRLLLGSTSERVVRDAGCAVLIVPRGD